MLPRFASTNCGCPLLSFTAWLRSSRLKLRGPAHWVDKGTTSSAGLVKSKGIAPTTIGSPLKRLAALRSSLTRPDRTSGDPSPASVHTLAHSPLASRVRLGEDKKKHNSDSYSSRSCAAVSAYTAPWFTISFNIPFQVVSPLRSPLHLCIDQAS
ncbi:hypothetical protein D3C77_523960 [compost metagenome]